ncbi:MAG TPA: Amuc_1100 family pilus-like protein, partial [Chthoniobacterales bacterium]|nr:Amuc_1100 family pilus-like protein [Chthoniobacterales bacterium]
MNSYREDCWLRNFLSAFAASLFLALWFLFHARREFAEASAKFNEVATQRMRLEHLNPFPNEQNFQKIQAALEAYGATLNKTKEDLKTQVVPLAPLAPNEFQSHLRQAIVNATERARNNRVKLPENFHLGFDGFTAALPDTAASPLLGQQLNQVELLVNMLIDNKVDAITELKRPIVPAEPVVSATRKPLTESPKVVERSVVDVTFMASPTTVRKILNQIASFEQQFFIIRTLHIRNEQPKGALREGGSSAGAGPNAPAPPGAIKFIVGNEHLEATASVEL